MRTDLVQLSPAALLVVSLLSLQKTVCLVTNRGGGVAAPRRTTAFSPKTISTKNSNTSSTTRKTRTSCRTMRWRCCGLAVSPAAETAYPWRRSGSVNCRPVRSYRHRVVTALLALQPPRGGGGGGSDRGGRRLMLAERATATTGSTATAPTTTLGAVTAAVARITGGKRRRFRPLPLLAVRILPHAGSNNGHALTAAAASTTTRLHPAQQHLRELTYSSSSGGDNAPRSPKETSQEDTIFALSTGNSGPAGVAVVRVSGPRSAQVLEALTMSAGTRVSRPPSADEDGVGDGKGEGRGRSGGGDRGRPGPPLPAPRRAVVRRLYDPVAGDLLDEALVLWMPGPRSFTGEDTVELHTHGSRAVINGVLDALGSLSGLGVRMAERGEFTQRAYSNGRMDLTGVEGLADLIAADTAEQRKQALRQMGGALRDKYEAWRQQLKECLAHAEAVIDFGDDEEDVGGDAAFFGAALPRVAALAKDIEAHLSDGGRGEIVREGLRAAIVGPPNAGKSSLLNLLAARPAAIVSPVAGTTRDVVEVQLDIAGLPVTLSDTAGLRDATTDEIEKEGMRRAITTVENAHLAIFVVDGTDPTGAAELLRRLKRDAGRVKPTEVEDSGSGTTGITEGAATTAAALEDVIIVVNKADLLLPKARTGEEEGEDAFLKALVSEVEASEGRGPGTWKYENRGRGGDGCGDGSGSVWKLSCKTREGLEELVGHLETVVRSRFQGAVEDNESPLITRRRHRQHVEACLAALRAAQDPALPLDLAAEELRIASAELGRITGAVDVEELLDVIFRDFCIGK